jgi:D-3-phosphoglycerate dehydrogenase
MEQEVVEEIKGLGNVTLTPSDLNSALANSDVLIVRSATKVTAELLTHAPKLKIVARAGVGLDNVDKAACEKRSIKVINTPGASSNSVAEHALSLMFALSRKVTTADAGMKGEKWLKKELTGTEIEGKTLGIVGLGRIGSILAVKAKALGMNVIYYDPMAPSVALGKNVSLEELFSSADFISLHVPLLDSTRHMINAETLAKMKPTAYIINTARGELINEKDLLEAVKAGRIGGAGLDVYPVEPYKGELCKLPNVICTPHVAGSTKEAQVRIGSELIQTLKKALGINGNGVSHEYSDRKRVPAHTR